MFSQLVRPEAVELLTNTARRWAYGWPCGLLAGWARWGLAR